MTDAPNTIDHKGHRYIRWDLAAALTASTISGFLSEVNGWNDAEKADVVAHAAGEAKPKRARKTEAPHATE